MKKLVHGGDIYSDEHKGFLDFSANVNPFGMPESGKNAIIENIPRFESYPDPLCRSLREKLAMKFGYGMEQIVCGNGAGDLIFKLALALKPKKAMVLAPTFSEYETALQLVECEVVYHYLTEENDYNINE